MKTIIRNTDNPIQPRRLDPLVETVLFRGAQEALTNVARHAGVGEATVRLSFEPRQVRLRVQDHGVGFVLGKDQLPEQSWGLAGMRERAESVGGHLSIDTKLGRGTLVEILVPNGKERMDAANSIDVGG